VFEPRTAAAPVPAPPPAPSRPRPEVVVRIHDDLSLGNSFAWISASIALALSDLGVSVSIAPTALSASFDPERAERLRTLVEHGPAPARVDAEIGWTHFWPQYQRPLGGRVPLALFAINYAFGGRDPAAFDPWLRQLLASGQPLAPISAFCRDVLADAGVAQERLRIVPMGVTDGIPGAEPGRVPGVRRLRLLHVTNAADVERNGTDLALDAYAAAFEPGDDVTLVVRDYGRFAPDLARRAQSLAEGGHDVRYWPAFFPQHRLGRFLGAFDALLAPFRGEGFGIKLLDAMASGVAPIAPFFGGPRDFLHEDAAFPVAYDLAPVREGYDAERLELGNDPRWAQCRPEALAAALRAAYEDPEEVARRGDRARERALGGFTWRHTAERIVALLAP
jgi:glycosyltransferase involved in cell wall biosynthesis